MGSFGKKKKLKMIIGEWHWKWNRNWVGNTLFQKMGKKEDAMVSDEKHFNRRKIENKSR